MSPSYPLAIIGGGCAGLSLVSELIRMGYDAPILVIEPRTTYKHDRTWCFWTTDEHQHTDLVSKRWSSWQISQCQRLITHVGESLSYQQIRSIDFYQAMLARIQNVPTVDMRQGLKATSLIDRGSDVQIETDAGTFSAEVVIDTRPPAMSEKSAPVWQIFSGAEIRTDTPCFTPNSAGLMTKMVGDAKGLRFLYVLPQSPQHALIQTTHFSLYKHDPSTLDKAFLKDLNALVSTPFQLERWERGLLPMGLVLSPQGNRSNVVIAGLAAGALRASSGYGFLRIQNWATQTAFALSHGQRFVDIAYGRRFETVMDSVFLKAFARYPENAADWFLRIATKLTGDEFAHFMSGAPDLRLWMKVVSVLPKRPFLRVIAADTPHLFTAKSKAS